MLDSIQVLGSWLGIGLYDSVKCFVGVCMVVDCQCIEVSGVVSIGDVMCCIFGVQVIDNFGIVGSFVLLNIGVCGLIGCYLLCLIVLFDGVLLVVVLYGQLQFLFVLVSLLNIELIDVVCGGGVVCYGLQNVGGIINFSICVIFIGIGLYGEVGVCYIVYDYGGGDSIQYNVFFGGIGDNGLGVVLLYFGQDGRGWCQGSDDCFNDFVLKFVYVIDEQQELCVKFFYYDVCLLILGGLICVQYEVDLFQNICFIDFWKGYCIGIDLGYINMLLVDSEFEVLVYYNESSCVSLLINVVNIQLIVQLCDYCVFGIELCYIQCLYWGVSVYDIIVGYCFLCECGNDCSYIVICCIGVVSVINCFDNVIDVYVFYIDDCIVIGQWWIILGVCMEWIDMDCCQVVGVVIFISCNDKVLFLFNIVYLLMLQLIVFGNYIILFGFVQNIQFNLQMVSNLLNLEVVRIIELGVCWQDGVLCVEVIVFKMCFDNQILQVLGIILLIFQNIGVIDYKGVESVLEYYFIEDSVLVGLELYVNYIWIKVIQQFGDNCGLDVLFYFCDIDSVGVCYMFVGWIFNVFSIYQSGQFFDVVNIWEEIVDVCVGCVLGVCLWNVQVVWQVLGLGDSEIVMGVNNLVDKCWYICNVDGNVGCMVVVLCIFYVQGCYCF